MEILETAFHPLEFLALAKLSVVGCSSMRAHCDTNEMDEEMRQCYRMLQQTSRSFAALITALDGELGHATCIFYLVLRALDTVEDDMSMPLNVKLPLLRSFHKNLYIPGWNYPDSRDKDAVVLHNFHLISAQFRGLAAKYQHIISDICRRMELGLAEFLEADTAVDTYQDFDQYCHYAAGLVGIGLSHLFSASGLEEPAVAADLPLANGMGVFLQKVNIIRDVYEDVPAERRWWPREVLRRTGNAHLSLDDLLRSEHREVALACLNQLISNTLMHLPDVVRYLSALKTPSVFAFCAIPQVINVALLERCYNNPQLFDGKVKIRSGQTALIVSRCTNMTAVKEMLAAYAYKIAVKMERAGMCEQASTLKVSLAEAGVMHTVPGGSSKGFTKNHGFLVLIVAVSVLIVALIFSDLYNLI